MKSLINKWTGFEVAKQLMAKFPEASLFWSESCKEFNVQPKFFNEPNEKFNSTVFMCTHHTGALDFMAIYPKLVELAPNLKIVMNNSLVNYGPFKEISIGVNPVSSSLRNDEALKIITEHLKTGGNILTFPAGRIAHRVRGRVRDQPWRTGLLEVILNDASKAVPILVDAENPNYFYFIRKFLPKLSVLFLLRFLRDREQKETPVYFGNTINNLNKKSFTMDNFRTLAYETKKEITI